MSTELWARIIVIAFVALLLITDPEISQWGRDLIKRR